MWRFRSNLRSAAIFWDLSSCPAPRNTNKIAITHSIRNQIQSHHDNKISIKTYNCYIEDEISEKLYYNALIKSGCTPIRSRYHKDRKECADNRIMCDALLFAMDHPNAALWIVTSDADFAYVLAKLKNRGFFTGVIYSEIPESNRLPEMCRQADCAVEWKNVIQDSFKRTLPANPLTMELNHVGPENADI